MDRSESTIADIVGRSLGVTAQQACMRSIRARGVSAGSLLSVGRSGSLESFSNEPSCSRSSSGSSTYGREQAVASNMTMPKDHTSVVAERAAGRRPNCSGAFHSSVPQAEVSPRPPAREVSDVDASDFTLAKPKSQLRWGATTAERRERRWCRACCGGGAAATHTLASSSLVSSTFNDLRSPVTQRGTWVPLWGVRCDDVVWVGVYAGDCTHRG